MMLAPSSAGAEPTDANRSAARTLATEGLRAFTAGNDQEAHDKFSRAEALVHATPHLLYIARTSARLGKLVEAKEAYVRIVREELPASAPKAFVEARKAATPELAALEPRIPRLTIVVRGSQAAPATVKMDGSEIPSALVGVASPTNPGKHVLHASAEGWEDVETTVTLAEGSRETATLAFSIAKPVAAKPSEAAPLMGDEPKKKSIAPWIAFGVGAAAAGVGTFFVFKNRGDRNDATDLCGGGTCPAARRNEVQDLDSSANSAATFAWISYGVAAAAAITGVVFYVKQSKRAPTTGITVVPWTTGTSGGITGSF